MLLALTRDVSPTLADCELTHLPRVPIDVPRAVAQHEQYRRRLAELGCHVLSLPAEPDFPDAVFVEDPLLVVDELAVLTRPGAASRRGEGASLAPHVADHRELVALQPPATLEGGDVVRDGRHLFVGLSTRTNAAGVEQLAALLAPHGYSVEGLAVPGALHLKSAVSSLGAGRLLVHRPWLGEGLRQLAGRELVDVPAEEPAGANVLRLGGSALVSSAHPRTAELLAGLGLEVASVDNGELLKAEAGVTCCSVIFEVDEPG